MLFSSSEICVTDSDKDDSCMLKVMRVKIDEERQSASVFKPFLMPAMLECTKSAKSALLHLLKDQAVYIDDLLCSVVAAFYSVFKNK
jgi:hypothetical protein